MDKLIILLDAEPVDQAAFADNEAIVACNNGPMLAYREDQKAIDKAVEWAEAQCLEFSACVGSDPAATLPLSNTQYLLCSRCL